MVRGDTLAFLGGTCPFLAILACDRHATLRDTGGDRQLVFCLSAQGVGIVVVVHHRPPASAPSAAVGAPARAATCATSPPARTIIINIHIYIQVCKVAAAHLIHLAPVRAEPLLPGRTEARRLKTLQAGSASTIWVGDLVGSTRVSRQPAPERSCRNSASVRSWLRHRSRGCILCRSATLGTPARGGIHYPRLWYE